MSLLVLFSIFLISYSIIIEIFTVLFQLSGITREKARTQVVSLLTNSGFTTSESEIILSSKRRRRLAQITMLCGYSFSVLIVSVLVNLVLDLKQSEVKELITPVICAVLILVSSIIIMRLPTVRKCFDLFVEKVGNRIMFGKHSNVLVLIDVYKQKAMVEIVLDNIPEFLQGIPLGKATLKSEYNIQILFIQRDGQMLEIIDGNTTLHKADKLMVFGDYKKIREVFEHPL